MRDTMQSAEYVIDKFMNIIIDYDSHCELEETEVQRRREQNEIDTHTNIQSKYNNKVTGKMKEQPMLQYIAKGIKNVYDGRFD